MASTANGHTENPIFAHKDPAAFKQAVDSAGIFPSNGPDPSARPWGQGGSGITFAAQHELPKQPLPSLESSCQRYLAALKPLQSASEQNATVEAVQNFLAAEGPILQAQLQQYNDCHENYFEHFCYQAFLGDDSPVVLNSNAFCSFKPDPDPSRNGQITRAASLVRSAVTFSQAIRDNELPPDIMRGVPMCSNQYWWLFGVARVPGDDGGRLRMDADARHIVVICHGQFYELAVLDRPSKQIITEQELSSCLQDIADDAQRSQVSESERSLGILTTQHQKTWSHCRKLLVQEDVQNGRNLGIIDSSLFVLCLDDNAPEQSSDICKNMVCGTSMIRNGLQVGTCSNRWYDKLAIIVCSNGAAGMNFEHTCTDGSVDIRMACDIYEGSVMNDKRSSANGDASKMNNAMTTAADQDLGGSASPKWQRLDWKVPQDIRQTLKHAESHLVDRIERHQLEAIDIADYGKAEIKSFSFSPDAFFQVILHAAHYRVYHRLGSGFEPVLMRQFLNGRTDVARTLTPATAAFALLFGDNKASVTEKVAAMRRAADAHVALSKDCAKGLSHHRHLYVLQQMWKRRQAFIEAAGLRDEAGTPRATIFTDPGWSTLNTTAIMGSNVDNPSIAYAGFGPPSDSGFTVCYYMRETHMAMSVCCRNGDAKLFGDAIRKTFEDVRAMLSGH